MRPERERYLQALEGQRDGWERLQAANREALRPLVETFRPRVIPGLDSYRETMARAVGDLTDAAAIPRYLFDLAAYGEASIAVLSMYAPDQHPHDVHPDRCWRCDALPGDALLGLCEPCRESLT